MPTFEVRIVANNDTGNWASWPEKIQDVIHFFAPVCNLVITLEKTSLTPKFAPYNGSAVSQVDEAWYEQNISALRTNEALLVFVVPPTDHPTIPTLLGIETGHPIGPWETTVFSDENDRQYVNGSQDIGNNCTVMIEHELCHAFYAMLSDINGGPEDNTHKYFFAGNPAGVLQDLNFTSELTILYQKLLAVLQELWTLKKKQQ